MSGADIRRSFLQYFESQGHRIAPSSSLVPTDDPTLLFTNAGMNQFKDVFLGREKRDYKRATTSQKCMRVSGKHNDLDNVGPSHRHHTFFEMLGNFSFGDYFKEDAIRFAWTVLTEVWGLPKDRLRASIFAGDATTPRDDEAFAIWKGILGDASRIDEFGAADNFWQMGETGPCGRCSEIFYDRRGMEHVPADDQLIEVWNNVFMEFNRLDGGVLEPLPARSIDTGMGLERITAVIQGRTSNYDTDLFQPILTAIGDLAGVRYAGGDTPAEVSMRVVADHLRATTFLISDGVIPSNEWRGYVLRKIMRRAMRHGKRLGLRDPFLHRLVDVVVAEFGGAYSDLAGSQAAVVNVVKGEEERFDAVLTAGLPRLEELLERAAASKDRTLPGDEAFRLYDSLGVPVDFIEDLAGERQLRFDREGYERAMEGQRERARAGSTLRPEEGRRLHLRVGRGAGGAGTDDGPLRRLRRDDRGRRRRRGTVRRGAGAGRRAGRRRDRLRRHRPDAVLPRGRRTGVRRRHAVGGWRRGDHRRRRAPRPRRPARASRQRHVRTDHDRRDGASRRRCRAPRCHPPQPHRHASAARRAPPGAGPARQAGRIAGGSGSPALRFRAAVGDPGRGDRAHRAHRQRRGAQEHAGHDRGQADRRGDGRRRDGAVRREVRRHRPRRLGAGLQPRAVRRHPRARHRRHRTGSRSPRSRGSPPASAASRPSPAPAPTSSTAPSSAATTSCCTRSAPTRARPRRRSSGCRPTSSG